MMNLVMYRLCSQETNYRASPRPRDNFESLHVVNSVFTELVDLMLMDSAAHTVQEQSNATWCE